MIRQKILTASVVVVTVAALLALNLPTALAQPPLNDNFGSAETIPGLPFSGTVDNTEATTEPGEPQVCNFLPNTVWYRFAPASNVQVRVDMLGSSRSDTHLNVYQAFGPDIFSLSFITCASFGSSTTFTAQAGQTYYIQAGFIFCGYPPCGGLLQLNLQEIVPPLNDNFVNAEDITGLPFSGSVNNTGATTESGEQFFCSFSPRTVWYKFMPPTSGFFTVDMFGSSFFDTVLTVYQAVGPGLGGLSFVNCTSFGGSLTLHLVGGTTYYFQAGDAFTGGGDLHLNLQEIPPPQPVASFGFSPGDPTVFDTVQFFDFSFDPGGVGIASQDWSLGDGTTATGCCPTHRYAADGDYTVQLTVTTFDGRTASTSQTVMVRTHDVAITKFLAPTSASAGQTRQISVGVRNSRYPETVRVDFYKSTPIGWGFIGSSEQFVPVRPSNRTTQFTVNYTFTGDDAAIGKVNFRAVANLLTARDALPTDNEAISMPTKVTR